MESTRLPHSLDEALDDVHLRFLANLPAEQELSVERLYFLLQEAHWYYEDFLASDERGVPHLGGGDFRRALFEHSSMLRRYAPQQSEFTALFKAYLQKIPSHGGILLDDTLEYVLLIKPLGGKSWGFPKGKIAERETPFDAAVREVIEEVGFDMRPYVADPEHDYVMARGGDSQARMYIAAGVPADGSIAFAPQARMEIGEICWFRVEDIPMHLGAKGGKRFFNVLPFMPDLKAWIAARVGPVYSPHGGGGGGGGAKKKKKKAKGGAANGVSGGGKDFVPLYAGLDELPPEATAPLQSAEAGEAGAKGWSVKDMFAANEKLLGRKFVYDGSPHTFGDASMEAVVTGAPMARTGLLQVKAGAGAAPAAAAGGEGSAKAKKKDAAAAAKTTVATPAPSAGTGKKAAKAAAAATGGGAKKAPAAPVDPNAFRFDMGPIMQALGL